MLCDAGTTQLLSGTCRKKSILGSILCIWQLQEISPVLHVQPGIHACK